MGEVRAVAAPLAPSAGSNEETAPPEGSEEEKEEEPEPKPKPKQQIPCDRVGSASIWAPNVAHDSVSLRWGFSTEPECKQTATFSVSRDGMHPSIDQNDPTLTDTGWARAERLTATAHTVTDLNADTVYQFRVVAYRRAADGDWHRTTAVNTEARTLAE